MYRRELHVIGEKTVSSADTSTDMYLGAVQPIKALALQTRRTRHTSTHGSLVMLPVSTRYHGTQAVTSIEREGVILVPTKTDPPSPTSSDHSEGISGGIFYNCTGRLKVNVQH